MRTNEDIVFSAQEGIRQLERCLPFGLDKLNSNCVVSWHLEAGLLCDIKKSLIMAEQFRIRIAELEREIGNYEDALSGEPEAKDGRPGGNYSG